MQSISSKALSHLQIFLRDIVIILGSFLVADYFYGILTIGIDDLVFDYVALQPIVLASVTFIMVFSIISVVGSAVSKSWFSTRFREQFWSLLLSIISVIVYAVSLGYGYLQLTVFTIISIFIAFCFTIWAAANPLPDSDSQLLKTIRRLWSQRYLISLWTRYNLEARYINSALGSLWIILQPLTSALVYTIVFGIIFTGRGSQDVPFIVFFLAGIVYWQLFASSLNQGANAVLKERGVLKQIQIPIDTLIVITFTTIVVDFLVLFVVMIIINAMTGVLPSIAYIYIPIIFFIQTLISLGFMFLVGSLTVFSRDIPQVVASFIRLLFYFSAIIYPISAAPRQLQAAIMLNPLTLLIDNFRNIIILGRPPNFLELVFPLMLGVTLFFSGFRFLKANERRFIDLM